LIDVDHIGCGEIQLCIAVLLKFFTYFQTNNSFSLMSPEFISRSRGHAFRE